MRKFICGLLLACLACAGASAAGAVEYFNVEMRVDVNGKSMGHQAIAEPGKKVRVMSKEDGQTVMRADYTLGPVGADEGGERIGRVSGMVFSCLARMAPCPWPANGLLLPKWASRFILKAGMSVSIPLSTW